MSAADTPFTLSCASVEKTQALAGLLAQHCGRGDCILLTGDLGAGKTAFAQGFIQSVRAPGDTGEITSPTFALAQHYAGKTGDIWHFDLYRLEDASELQEIGLEEALDTALTLIEWPEIASNMYPADALSITIETTDNNARALTFRSAGSRWDQRLSSLRQQFQDIA